MRTELIDTAEIARILGVSRERQPLYINGLRKSCGIDAGRHLSGDARYFRTTATPPPQQPSPHMPGPPVC